MPTGLLWISVLSVVIGVLVGVSAKQLRARANLGFSLAAEQLLQAGVAKAEVRESVIAAYERAGFTLVTDGADTLVFEWRRRWRPWHWALIVLTAPIGVPATIIAWAIGFRLRRWTLDFARLAGPGQSSRLLAANQS